MIHQNCHGARAFCQAQQAMRYPINIRNCLSMRPVATWTDHCHFFWMSNCLVREGIGIAIVRKIHEGRGCWRWVNAVVRPHPVLPDYSEQPSSQPTFAKPSVWMGDCCINA